MLAATWGIKGSEQKFAPKWFRNAHDNYLPEGQPVTTESTNTTGEPYKSPASTQLSSNTGAGKPYRPAPHNEFAFSSGGLRNDELTF